MGPTEWQQGYTFISNVMFAGCALMVLGGVTVVVRTERLRVKHERRVRFHPAASLVRRVANGPYDWAELPEYT